MPVIFTNFEEQHELQNLFLLAVLINSVLKIKYNMGSYVHQFDMEEKDNGSIRKSVVCVLVIVFVLLLILVGVLSGVLSAKKAREETEAKYENQIRGKYVS